MKKGFKRIKNDVAVMLMQNSNENGQLSKSFFFGNSALMVLEISIAQKNQYDIFSCKKSDSIKIVNTEKTFSTK